MTIKNPGEKIPGVFHLDIGVGPGFGFPFQHALPWTAKKMARVSRVGCFLQNPHPANPPFSYPSHFSHNPIVIIVLLQLFDHPLGDQSTQKADAKERDDHAGGADGVEYFLGGACCETHGG
jgi:hypothetical protein